MKCIALKLCNSVRQVDGQCTWRINILIPIIPISADWLHEWGRLGRLRRRNGDQQVAQVPEHGTEIRFIAASQGILQTDLRGQSGRLCRRESSYPVHRHEFFVNIQQAFWFVVATTICTLSCIATQITKAVFMLAFQARESETASEPASDFRSSLRTRRLAACSKAIEAFSWRSSVRYVRIV